MTNAKSAVSLDFITDSTNGASRLPKLDTSGRTPKDGNSIMNDELESISIGNYVNEEGDSTNEEMKVADEESCSQQKVKNSE